MKPQDAVSNEAEKRRAAFVAGVTQDAIAALNNARHYNLLHQTKEGGKLHGLTNRQRREVFRKQARETRELMASVER